MRKIILFLILLAANVFAYEETNSTMITLKYDNLSSTLNSSYCYPNDTINLIFNYHVNSSNYAIADNCYIDVTTWAGDACDNAYTSSNSSNRMYDYNYFFAAQKDTAGSTTILYNSVDGEYCIYITTSTVSGEDIPEVSLNMIFGPCLGHPSPFTYVEAIYKISGYATLKMTYMSLFVWIFALFYLC